MTETEGVNIYMIGTAGSGKSSLTGAFKDWMSKMGFNCFIINLDPGAEGLAYEPDLDIREWITLVDVMEEYGLGPNGAQIVAADLLALNLQKLLERKKDVNADYFIIDTPGQMELFTFRSSSVEIIRALGENSFIVYIIDGLNAQTPYSMTSQLMLSATTQFRFGIPAANVLAMVARSVEDSGPISYSRENPSSVSTNDQVSPSTGGPTRSSVTEDAGSPATKPPYTPTPAASSTVVSA